MLQVHPQTSKHNSLLPWRIKADILRKQNFLSNIGFWDYFAHKISCSILEYTQPGLYIWNNTLLCVSKATENCGGVAILFSASWTFRIGIKTFPCKLCLTVESRCLPWHIVSGRLKQEFWEITMILHTESSKNPILYWDPICMLWLYLKCLSCPSIWQPKVS